MKGLTIKAAESKLRGNTRALFIVAKVKQSKYQFVFTHVVQDTPRLFTTVRAVHTAYDSSRLYREVFFRFYSPLTCLRVIRRDDVY